MKNHFILARYKENITKSNLENAIINRLKDKSVNVEIFIYDKFSSKEDTYKLVPNVGREHYAWFTHIIDTWDNPPDFYSFIHPCGPASTERPDKFNHLMKVIDDFNKNEKPYSPLDNDENKKSQVVLGYFNGKGVNPNFSKKDRWFGNTISNIDDVRKQRFTPANYRNFGEWWKSTMDKVEFPSLMTISGVCMASNENIQSWGLDFWKIMFDMCIQGGTNGEMAHYLERAMYRLAMGKR